MDLTPPPPVGALYTSREKLVLAVNNHAGPVVTNWGEIEGGRGRGRGRGDDKGSAIVCT